MGFQWDAEKDVANQAKHHLGFREAAEVFRGFRLTVEDTRRAYGERRFITLGMHDGAVLRVVYTHRDGDVRIISAWKASKNDREAYARARSVRPF